MGAREVIAEGCCRPDWNKLDMADHIISLLHKSGHVILSPDEVRGIRDEALEEAAVAAERTYAKDPFRFELNTAAAATIRSMKGGRDAQ